MKPFSLTTSVTMICKWIFVISEMLHRAEPHTVNSYQIPPKYPLEKQQRVSLYPKPRITCAPLSASSLLKHSESFSHTALWFVSPPLAVAPTTDTSSTSLGIHFRPCYVWKKIQRKVTRRLTKHLAKAFLTRLVWRCRNCRAPWEAEQHSGKVWGDGRVLWIPTWIASFSQWWKMQFFFLLLLCFFTLIACLSYLLSWSHLCKA